MKRKIGWMMIVFGMWLVALASCDDSGKKSDNNANNTNNVNNNNQTNNTNNINNTNNTNNVNNTNNANNTNNTNNTTCPPVPEVGPTTRLAVLLAGTDNGSLGELDASVTPPAFRPDLLVAHSDSTVRAGMGRVFVVGRMGGDYLLAADDETFAVDYQTPLGAGSNPQDVALVSTCKAYVSLYQNASLAVVDPTSGSLLRTLVSLAEYADADGSPEAAWMAKVDDATVAVAIQNLENWAPSRNGRILLVDAQNDAVAGAIELTSRNPFSPLVRVGENTFAVGCVDDFSGNQGGIEVFDTQARTSRLAVTASALEGVPTDLAMEDENCGYALVNTPAWESGIRAFCLDGTVGSWVLAPGRYTLTGIAMTDDLRLVVADATANAAGLRLVDVATGTVSELIATPLAPGFTKPLAFLP